MGKTIDVSFPDHQQSFWHLASIQVASFGVPYLLFSGQLASQIGIGKAITSVIIGNLLQWIIGLAVISMAAYEKNNALQNTNKYLGTIGGVLAALFLAATFISWYIIQIDSSVIVIKNLFDGVQSPLRWGAALGAFIALLSIGGIVLIRKISVYSLPILFLFIIYMAYLNLPAFSVPEWGFSFLGIITILSTNLPGIVNLPTFFRHSRSTADSFLGLSSMTVLYISMQLLSIVAGYNDISSFSSSEVNKYSMAAFVILALVIVNLVNIYFAAASWEIILPNQRSAKEYVIVGLLGTIAYTFLQITPPMTFLENTVENFISSLGIILMLAFLVKIVVRHRPRFFEQSINVICWLFGGIMGTIALLKSNSSPASVLIISTCSTSVFFLFVIFVEETVWSIKKIFESKSEA